VIAAIRQSAVIAAVLSFVLPGLGQGWVGAHRRALLLALPIMLLLAAGVLVLVVEGRARALGVPHLRRLAPIGLCSLTPPGQ
jgi:hypothetical protein